jgi:hypothetical protein
MGETYILTGEEVAGGMDALDVTMSRAFAIGNDQTASRLASSENLAHTGDATGCAVHDGGAAVECRLLSVEK